MGGACVHDHVSVFDQSICVLGTFFGECASRMGRMHTFAVVQLRKRSLVSALSMTEHGHGQSVLSMPMDSQYWPWPRSVVTDHCHGQSVVTKHCHGQSVLTMTMSMAMVSDS